MAIAWVNFRGTLGGPAGFPGDGADVYSLGTAYSSGTPDPAIGGVYPQGWGSTGNTGAAQDVSSAYPTVAHQAGRVSATTGLLTQEYHIGGLTIGNTYRLYMSSAGLDILTPVGFAMYSATGASGLITSQNTAGNLAVGSMMDIAGNIFTSPALWLAGQGWFDWVATTTGLFFTKSTNNMRLTAIGIEDITAPPPPSSLTSTAMMMGV